MNRLEADGSNEHPIQSDGSSLTERKVYPCSDCSMTFMDKTEATKHFISEHNKTNPINLDPELDDIQVTYPYECTACGIRFQQITEAEDHFSSQHQKVEESKIDVLNNEILLEKSSDVHEREMQDISDLLSLNETAQKFAAGFINEDPVLNETVTLTYENQSVMLSSGHELVSSVFEFLKCFAFILNKSHNYL